MTDSQIIKNILEELINKRLIKNERDFCLQMAYPTGNLSKIKSGERRIPSSLKLDMQDKFRVNPKYISGQSKEMFLSNVVEDPSHYENASPYLKGNGRKNLIVVPLKAFGGFLAGYKDKVYLDSLEHHTFPWIQGECFAFEVEGFSMYKTKLIDGEIFEVGYKPGSFVVATPIEKFEGLMKGREYVFQTTDGIIVKRFVKLKGDYCEVESINDEYNPVKPLHLKSIKRMYYVEQNIKKP